jgi:hypothetical protein
LAPVQVPLDDVPPEQGNVLKAVRRGGDVVLSFRGAEASRWRLYADPGKEAIGRTPLGADVERRTGVDPGAVDRPGPSYYSLRGVSRCSGVAGPP